MDKIFYRGEDIEDLSREKLLKCIRLQQEMAERDRKDGERRRKMFKMFREMR